MPSQRLSRALKLLNLVRHHGVVKAEFLADVLDCSKRTVFRDIKLLNLAGIKISFSNTDGGYVLAKDNELGTGPLSDDERLSLLLGCANSFLAKISPFREAVELAEARLLGNAPQETRTRHQRLKRLIHSCVYDPSTEAVTNRVFQQLAQAMEKNQEVRLWWAPQGSRSRYQTVFWGYGLFAMPSGWEAFGESALHQSPVFLSLTAIQAVQPTGNIYAIPESYANVTDDHQARKLHEGCPTDPLPGPNYQERECPAPKFLQSDVRGDVFQH